MCDQTAAHRFTGIEPRPNWLPWVSKKSIKVEKKGLLFVFGRAELVIFAHPHKNQIARRADLTWSLLPFLRANSLKYVRDDWFNELLTTFDPSPAC